MKFMQTLARCSTVAALALLFLAGPLPAARDDIAKPPEYGVYVKTAKKLIRIIPNIVFDQDSLLYIESNNPAHFPLNDIRYFVVYGKFNTQVMTVNNLLFVGQSPLGKVRFMFGKEVDVEVRKRGDNLYSVKPKGLFGRGYYAIWIEDSAWDFIVE
jgi:hypothetical protein